MLTITLSHAVAIRHKIRVRFRRLKSARWDDASPSQPASFAMRLSILAILRAELVSISRTVNFDYGGRWSGDPGIRGSRELRNGKRSGTIPSQPLLLQCRLRQIHR